MKRAIEAMVADGCEEVALEAEVTNSGALRLYQKLGFIRDKRLLRWGGRRAGHCWPGAHVRAAWQGGSEGSNSLAVELLQSTAPPSSSRDFVNDDVSRHHVAVYVQLPRSVMPGKDIIPPIPTMPAGAGTT